MSDKVKTSVHTVLDQAVFSLKYNEDRAEHIEIEYIYVTNEYKGKGLELEILEFLVKTSEHYGSKLVMVVRPIKIKDNANDDAVKYVSFVMANGNRYRDDALNPIEIDNTPGVCEDWVARLEHCGFEHVTDRDLRYELNAEPHQYCMIYRPEAKDQKPFSPYTDLGDLDA